MENTRSSKILVVYTALVISFLAVLCPKTAKSAETDSYTYACIQLEDSADKINLKLNEILRGIFEKVNHEIVKFNHKSDVYTEFYFSHFYNKQMFYDEYGLDAFSVFETCIDTNTCEDWPYFERIYVKPNESVYFEAQYNNLTNKFLATNVQACGVRFGTDKLTHLLKEGFKFFNATKEADVSKDDILRYSKILEETFFGKTATGVFSNADIVANMNGVEFFNDIFAKHLVRLKNGQVKFTDIDICNYIEPKFDERVNPNIYSESKERVALLKRAISKRPQQCDASLRDKILSRTLLPQSVAASDLTVMGFKNILPFLSSSDFRRAQEIMSNDVTFQKRKTTPIRKEK